jgi:catechol 2,3-dioxygenase-like lactoylglutathione lyase family enzyme
MTNTPHITGILVASLPVADLARSVAFYRDLLGLTYAREFSDTTGVTGCALADVDTGYMITFRLRSTTQGHADLRGEHPVILGLRDRRDVQALHDDLTARGFAPTTGVHADAAWVEVVDPDGIAIRFAWATAAPGFFGVMTDGTGFYDEPRLTVPAQGQPEEWTRASQSLLNL